MFDFVFRWLCRSEWVHEFVHGRKATVEACPWCFKARMIKKV